MLKILFFLLLLPIVGFGQQDDLSFLVQKIKVDYPGYREKTKGKGFDLFVRKTIQESKSDTFKMMSRIVGFFKDRHLDLFQKFESSDTLSCDKNLEQIISYFKSHKHLKKYEGFWKNESNYSVIAIQQISRDPLQYQAYIIKTRDSNLVHPGILYYRFEEEKGSGFRTLAVSISSKIKYYVWSTFRNDSVMTAGPYNKWKKLFNYKEPILPSFEPDADSTTGKWLDSNNYLIRIPGSNQHNGEIAARLIKENPGITHHLKNLIVDIRGNTGGRVIAYDPLLPLLYTNPILKVNGYTYCTKDGADDAKKDIAEYLAKGKIDSTYLKDLEGWEKEQRDSIGKFVLSPQDTLILDTILPYPKHVSIITDFGCQSAAEIFLLDAKQSKKVTLFGEHTMGAIDYLDFYPMKVDEKKIAWKYYDKSIDKVWDNFNLGISHGNPAIILILGLIYEHYPDYKDRLEPFIIKAMHWLSGNKNTSGEGSYFSGYTMGFPNTDYTPLRWCYGDMGIGFCYYLTGKRTMNAVWVEEGISILENCVKRLELELVEIDEAHICHGAAGLGHMFNRIYQDTEIEDFKIAAVKCFEKVLEQAVYEDGNILFYSNKGEYGRIPFGGLMEGSLGIALTLLATISNAEPKWDRLFLLS
jgi:hypothetical protein